jgi:hypothetical protein
LGRLSQKEFGGFEVDFELIDMNWVEEARGTMLGLVFLVHEKEYYLDWESFGEWCSVAQMPHDAVEYQWLTCIPRAVAEFKFRGKLFVQILDFFARLCGGRIIRKEAFIK